jgi:predicted O-methyltransferase YrrM
MGLGVPQDLDTFVGWLKSRQRRLDIPDPELMDLFWRVHPRLRFLKAAPWGVNLIDIGAGNGGLAHWRHWGKPDRPDLTLYGVDLSIGEHAGLYAGWEAINLDRQMPEFPGVKLDGFFASHLLEYLGAPEGLIEWIGKRAEPGARVYLEWTNPISLDLPTREQLQKHEIEVVTSNFIDDWAHKQAPDLARLSGWLKAAGFELISSGAIDLGILGEELFARGADRDSRTMGYWSMTRSSLYAIAVKAGDAAIAAQETAAIIRTSRVLADPAQPPAAAKTAREDLTLLRAKRALLVSGLFDAEFYRATYRDMQASTADPLTHYITNGEAEGRSPNPVFFPRYYRRRWMAGAPATQNALAHYAEEGERLGHKPHPAFDPPAYLAANPPLAEFVDRPLFHYLHIGRAAGLPVAPGPDGAKLARVIEAQPYAAAFEYSGRRDRDQLMRYKQVLVQELEADEGSAFYEEMFDLPDDDRMADGSAATTEPAPGPASDEIEHWLRVSEAIPGSTRGELAREIARISLSLPPDAEVVEIGSFFGAGTVLLAGPRKSRGSGKVHAVDPFDCSGDPRSAPIYERILQKAGGGSLRDHFDENMRSAGLSDWVEVHQGFAGEIAANWTKPVDMIFVDLDPAGEAAGDAFKSWLPFLKAGGVIAIHNSEPDGPRPPVEEQIRPPCYADLRVVDGTTIARKMSA